MARIIRDIAEAAQAIRMEDVIGLPTETVYGLAGDIHSEKAIARIFEIKKRPAFNPLIVHIGHIDQLKEIAQNITEELHTLAHTFWPGPLTLLLEKKDSISPKITAGKETVAVRMPAHPMALSLLQQLARPLAAPSANPFQSVSPTTADHVYQYFNKELNIILDGGPCTQGIESTIIGYHKGKPQLFRHGAVPLEAIEKITGPLLVNTHEDTQPVAPGMLGKHYSPRTRLLLTQNINAALLEHTDKKTGLLTFQERAINAKVAYQRALSIHQSLEEAAAQLYAALHELDALGLDLIIAEQFPDEGIGRSINDRLQRAATLK